jgi:hypothetical protein
MSDIIGKNVVSKRFADKALSCFIMIHTMQEKFIQIKKSIIIQHFNLSQHNRPIIGNVANKVDISFDLLRSPDNGRF